MYRKLIYMKNEQKEALDEIQDEIVGNGGQVSLVRLIQDAIMIFIQHYRNEAIERYSSVYDKKT